MSQGKPPIICVPDTNALVHLRHVKVMNQGACLLLWKEFEVRVGDEIPKEMQNLEARRSGLRAGEISGNLDRSVTSLSADYTIMEKCFFDHLGMSFNAEDDKGERINSQLSLQLVAQNSARQIIFLTDELKILRPNTGFVKKLFDTYPIGIVWNSLDYLTYLFFRHRRFIYPQAEDAVRDVNAKIGGSAEESGSRLTFYTRRLKAIDTARSKKPELWRSGGGAA